MQAAGPGCGPMQQRLQPSSLKMRPRRQYDRQVSVPRGSNWVAPQPIPCAWPQQQPPQQSQQSPWPASARRAAPPLRGSMFELDELQYEGSFDLSQQALKTQLLQKMRMQPSQALLEPMRGGIGSCNAGMWILRDSSQCLVLKLVPCRLLGPNHCSESDKFAKLARENPRIVQDPSLSFPSKLFHCVSNGTKTHDLVVMSQCPGKVISEFIMQKLHSKQVQDLMRVLEQFGAFLADFHARYNGMQHGDLTPANIFYDQLTGRFTLVDVADLAPRNPVIQSDTERFASSLKLLSHFFGPELFMQGKAQFEAGYTAVSRRAGCMPMRTA